VRKLDPTVYEKAAAEIRCCSRSHCCVAILDALKIQATPGYFLAKYFNNPYITQFAKYFKPYEADVLREWWPIENRDARVAYLLAMAEIVRKNNSLPWYRRIFR
jgi:hypothetical protein